MNTIISAQSPKEFAEIWDKQHISKMPPSNVRHKDLQAYLEFLKRLGLPVTEVGRSYQNREIYQVEWGKGNLKVFMWSQMHGDEPTATSALMDMLAFLQTSKLAWVKKLSESITLRAVPMLNPDGAEMYQRRNAQFIDINRDAQSLSTPEGRLLKRLRDEWQPDIGFNLHNQNSLTTVGSTKKQATISLLAVSGNLEGKSTVGFERNKRICSVMINALNQFIKGNIGRYEDDYNPRAFGDRISEWGTPVILIETGALHGKLEMFLIRLNFVAFLTALQSLVDGSEQKADPKVYETLPFNSDGGIYDFIFRGATIVPDGGDPYVADVAVVEERRRADEGVRMIVREIGDLGIYTGLEEFDMKDFYLFPSDKNLRNGSPAQFRFFKKSRQIDLKNPTDPDKTFVQGKWVTISVK
ncbi:MAG: hypothetical protein K1X72_22690 [Pyrinomonadaceae bacterium]|nr:hypothetical protein [Pyrinomonadaceae bacterium]